MNLVEVGIQNVRIIRYLNIAPGRGLNIFIGPNGSGKTSVLEGIYLLGRGRSFRGRIYKTIITQGEDNCVVSALVDDGAGARLRIGIERGKHGGCVKVGTKEVRQASELAKNLPLLFLSPDSQRLLTEGAKKRQHFLDWILFHVEPTYFDLLYRYLRVLRQRNAVLRQAGGKDLLKIWNEELGNLGELIDKYRRKSVEVLSPILHQYLGNVLNIDVVMEYSSGWDRNMPLVEVLNNRLESDEKLGYTLRGPHRGDLNFLLQGSPVSQRLSRGEAKRFVFALVLAQARCLIEQANIIPVVLIDELIAELDKQSIYAIFQTLMMLKTQVFITAVSEQQINKNMLDEAKLFHVEQGVVNAF